MSGITSLTQKAFLNSTVLDWIYPSNSPLKTIEQSSFSASEALVSADSTLYATSPVESSLHRVMKPVRFIERGIYTFLVLSVIAPLGIVINGANTIGSGCQYLWCKASSESTGAASKKVTAYAKAFFTDATSLGVGLLMDLLTAAVIGSLFYLTVFDAESRPILVSPLFKGSMASALLISYSALSVYSNPALSIPFLVADADEKIGMFLALEARNELGFVRENGNLLRFSSADKITYEKVPFGTDFSDNQIINFPEFQDNILSNSKKEELQKFRDEMIGLARFISDDKTDDSQAFLAEFKEGCANFMTKYEFETGDFDLILNNFHKLVGIVRKHIAVFNEGQERVHKLEAILNKMTFLHTIYERAKELASKSG